MTDIEQAIDDLNERCDDLRWRLSEAVREIRQLQSESGRDARRLLWSRFALAVALVALIVRDL